MLEIHSSQAKNPNQTVRNYIRENSAYLFVYLDADTILPINLAYQGACFRLPLDRETIICADLRKWFNSQKAYHKDHLLFTILDWETGLFQLERETARQRDEKLLEQRNKLLADTFFDLLEHARRESLFTFAAVPTAYARLSEKGGYPPYYWILALELDGRMEVDFFQINYKGNSILGGLFDPLKRSCID